MASAQPQRTSPYSEELRWRVIYQVYGLSLTYRQIARNLNIDVSTVCRIVRRFEETGNVSKRVHPRGYNHHLRVIMELVTEKPGIYLREIQAEVYSLRGKPAKALSMLPRGNHFFAIAAMCSEGVLACKVVEGAVNAETFETFLSIELSSELFPFDGVNPRSIG